MVQTLFHTRNDHSHTNPRRKSRHVELKGAPNQTQQGGMAVHSAESLVGPSLHITSILHPDWARIRKGTAQASQNSEARTDTTPC